MSLSKYLPVLYSQNFGISLTQSQQNLNMIGTVKAGFIAGQLYWIALDCACYLFFWYSSIGCCLDDFSGNEYKPK